MAGGIENQVRIKRIVSWVFPYFGNRHTMPYGKLEITDGVDTKIVSTKGDTVETYDRYGCQYITFKRKPYKVCGWTSQTGKFRLSREPIV